MHAPLGGQLCGSNLLRAIPAELVESGVLFGYAPAPGFIPAARRAASAASARQRRPIFLDEVNLLTATMHPSFSVYFREMGVDQWAGEKSILIDVRAIAASILAGDAGGGGTIPRRLYYRLNVITHQDPTLRERRRICPCLWTTSLSTGSTTSRHGHLRGWPRRHGPADGLRLAGQRPSCGERGGGAMNAADSPHHCGGGLPPTGSGGMQARRRLKLCGPGFPSRAPPPGL